MMKKRYTLVHMPFLAFFSKRLYREVGRRWRGANLAYLFLLLAICCIPATLHMRKHMLQSLETGQLEILNQLPDIQITNGRVIMDQQQPLYLNRKDGSPLAIIDTTGSMNYIDDPNVVFLLTESKLIVRRGTNLFNTLDLSSVSDLHIDKYILNEWFQTVKSAIAPLSYGLFLMVSYIFSVLALLLVAVVGLIIASIMHSPLSFAGAMRIAILAATPSIIATTVSAALGNTVPGIVYIGITLLYLLIGIKCCNSPAAEEEEHIDLKSMLHEDASDDLLENAA